MKICPHCKYENPATAKFCSNCGNDLRMANSESHQPRSAERRQLTVLFCDLVGSTALSEDLDPEEFRQIITDYHHVAEKVIQQFGGHIGQYLGDGLLVYFGYPKGLEDAPRSGVQAGLGILDAVNHANQQWKSEGKAEISVRIGVHTGLVVVDDHLALGETVNVAARLEGLAPQNGLVISPQNLKLVQGWFEVKSLGESRIKGLSRPIEIFQVISESTAQTRLDVAKGQGLTPLVGREKELAFLEEKWTTAKHKDGNLVLLNGEAGIGKTRLVDSLEQIVKSEKDVHFSIARSSSYHINSAFFQLINWLENQIVKFESSDTMEIKEEKLKNFLVEYDLDAETNMPLLAEFLSISSNLFPPLAISPTAKRQKTMESLSQILLTISDVHPVLFVLEDLHWADASTLEWLKQFLDTLASKSILIVCTTRPDFHPEWDDHPTFSQLNLPRLATDTIKVICHHHSKGKTLPEELLKHINKKTEGVPLFVEELTKMVLESGMLIENENNYELKGELNTLSIPSTLQDSLLARLDRLSPVKEIVEVGAVLGREFSFEILLAITQQDASRLEQALSTSIEAEILSLKKEGEQTVYQFKHALIQEATYESILKSRRHQLHQTAASVLENKFPSITEPNPELLAHHYTLGGLPLQAIPLWLKAGQLASQKNAGAEAISHLEKGLELLPHIESETERRNLELDFQLTLGGTFVVVYGFPHPKVKSTFDKAREIAQSIEVSPKLALVLMNLVSYYMNTEDYVAAIELHKYTSKLAQDPDHGYWFRICGDKVMAGAETIQGHFSEASTLYKNIIEKFNPALPFPWELTPSGYIEIGAKGWLMTCLQILGYYEESKSLSDQHLDYVKDHKDSVTLYHIYTFPPLRNLIARDWQETTRGLDLYLPIVREFGDPVFVLTAEVYYSIARAFQGDREAFEKALHLFNVCFDIGFKAFAASMCAWIGELYYQFEKFDESLEWVEKMLAHVNKTGSHIQTAELFRVKGLVQQALGQPDDEAEKSFRLGLEKARDQSAKTYEIRAARDLAKLLQKQGRNAEAKKLLQEVYDWFPPGIESVDLKEAKDLLDEL